MICYKDMQLMMAVISTGGVAIFFAGFFLSNKFILIFGLGFTIISIIISVYCGFKVNQRGNYSITSGEAKEST
jgi:hypothetical protein